MAVKLLFQRTNPAGCFSEVHGTAVGVDKDVPFLAGGKGYLHWSCVGTHNEWVPCSIAEALDEAEEPWQRLRGELGDEETWKRLVRFHGGVSEEE